MVDREESRLKAMNLTKLSEKDMFISQDDEWDLRSQIHDELKNSSLVTKKTTGSFHQVLGSSFSYHSQCSGCFGSCPSQGGTQVFWG